MAVDATGATIMGHVPEWINHLKRAAILPGNTQEAKIEQLGESIASVCFPY